MYILNLNEAELRFCACFDVSVLLLVVGWFTGARAIPLIGGGVPWLIAQSLPQLQQQHQPSTSRFQATIFAPVMELNDQEGIWADMLSQIKSNGILYADQYCSLLTI